MHANQACRGTHTHSQESLGGNAKTTLLVNVAGVQEHIDETLQSLQFASRAMCVKNKPIVSVSAV